jgi:hypothetical protein
MAQLGTNLLNIVAVGFLIYCTILSKLLQFFDRLSDTILTARVGILFRHNV